MSVLLSGRLCELSVVWEGCCRHTAHQQGKVDLRMGILAYPPCFSILAAVCPPAEGYPAHEQT